MHLSLLPSLYIITTKLDCHQPTTPDQYLCSPNFRSSHCGKMMPSGSNMYARGGSNEAYQLSPAIHAAERRLTPHSPYKMDVRRNSDVSALSLSSSFSSYSSDFSVPPTPICARSPLTTESFDANAFDLSHHQSLNRLPLDFQQKQSGFDDSWSSFDASCNMGQNMPMRNFETFASHGNYLHSPGPTYVGLEATSAIPWCTPTSSTSYPTYEGHMSMDGLDVDHNTTMHSMWNMQLQQMQAVSASNTIVPQEAMLEGEIVRVDTPDISMEPYDDMDGPLPPSPQQVVFKHESSPSCIKSEGEFSDDCSRMKRSIRETRTGGKSIKREKRHGKVTKPKGKDKPFITKLWDGEIKFDRKYTQDPDSGKFRYADEEPRPKFQCKYPFDDDDASIPSNHPDICGKMFQRTEHRQRHRKTHSPSKEFPCLLCDKNFNRNDNCWAHGFTHVHRPGKKDGRNKKFSLRQVISVLTDPKHIDKLLKDWKKEVGKDYVAEDDEDDNEEFMDHVHTWNPDRSFRYIPEDAIEKIRAHRM
ncbi:hypothetical protein IAQ61_005092 [Plenodomus lingam]|uniref:uncharacterized protein n=1 Tax=Leptosphaeria maculans TaxID=5022 RepID=UPI00333376AD|nr:hypothetical protein IAQ61_005092 [Plenodomus lingam]